jgi:hypothetical protein
MRTIQILTDRKNFSEALTRGELPPHGVAVHSVEPVEAWQSVDPGFRVELRVNLRAISSTGFALWILRRLRSIPGDHQILISGQPYPTQMPEAIDLIADALVNAKRSKQRLAA